MKTLAILLAVLAAGCTRVDTYHCLQSSECINGGLAGICEPGNLCSFPDPSCPSGKAFGEYAGDQSMRCVGDAPGATSDPTSDGPGTSTSSGSATGSGTSDGAETTVDLTTTMSSEVSATTGPMMTTDATMTSEPNTTGPSCAALGDSCANTPCCGGPCTTCTGDRCQARAADAGPMACGSDCQVCDQTGECATAPAGQDCPLDCAQIVLGAKQVDLTTACLGHGAKALSSVCDDQGACSTPDPVEAGCDDMQPTVIAACDTVCVKDLTRCTPGAIGVLKADLCALNTTTAGCQPSCVMDATSDNASCDAAGGCKQDIKSCGNFKCNPADGLCRTKCMSNSDCVSNKCQGSKCQ